MKLILGKMIDQAEAKLGYRFGDKTLLMEALTHSSIAETRASSNERMEFLGDSVLGLLVSEYLYEKYPEELEGVLTKIKSAVVSRRVCAAISSELGLSGVMSFGKGMVGRSKLPLSVDAAVLESVIAAIYLDGGIEAARTFVIGQVARYIEEAAQTAHQYNFKSVLQQHAQQHFPKNPVYVLLDNRGPDHAKEFQICVELEGQRFDPAWGKSKKNAEQQAAWIALCELGLIKPEERAAEAAPGPASGPASGSKQASGPESARSAAVEAVMTRVESPDTETDVTDSVNGSNKSKGSD